MEQASFVVTIQQSAGTYGAINKVNRKFFNADDVCFIFLL